MSPTMQQATTVKVPHTRAELEAMVARRNELQAQLRQAEERRAILGEQVPRTGAETRATVIQRVEALDQRITQLERQIAQMDEAVSRRRRDLRRGGFPQPAPVAVETYMPVIRGRLTLASPSGAVKRAARGVGGRPTGGPPGGLRRA